MTKNSCPECKKSKNVLEILVSKPFPLTRGYFAALKNHKNGYPPKVEDLRSAFLIAIYAKSIEYADSLRKRCGVPDFMA